LYGYLGVLIPIEFHWDDDEIALLSEIAADIALALRGIQSEEERVRMEAQLGRLQRLEAVGQLAGGVAHDFNNLFMGIMSYVELCRDEIASDHPIRVWLDEITEDAQRSADLTRQLLAFARRQVSTPRVLDLNDAVGDSLRTLRRILGEDIALVWQPSIRDCRVKMDPGQVVQILTSLCSNARDAIAGVGRVTISTDTVRVTAELCAQEEDAVPGDYVMLRVFDDGCGMDPEDLDRVFEPFFTTRNVGEGTGLGLSTVYGIVRQNGGFVTVDSAPGVGTAFQVYLPRVESGAAEVERGEPCRGGGETVLVVEDEKSVRIPATRFLERLGYHVLSAAHPGDALRLAGAHAGSIDLVVTDVVMPGMSGRDLVKALVESRPGLRSLFISGYPVGTITEPRGAPGEGAAFLQKPFGREDLARRVREVLDAPPGPGRARTAPASPRSRDEDPR
jgi:signal transduction histidine kinase/ActR/RegA family two-component response regulator